MKKHIVALSGGKDSTAMALRLKELNPGIDYNYAITPTGDELPEMLEHWRNLERLLGKELIRLNNMTLEECIVSEGMIPNFRARFCTRILKIEPFIDFMNTLPADSIMYVGLRADEDGRLGIIPPAAEFTVNMPMQEWEWTIADVKRYLQCNNIDVPVRTDCGACFYQKISEWAALLQNYPDRYQHYINIEKRVGHTFRSPGRDTWPADLEGLRAALLSGRKVRKYERRQGAERCRFCSM